MRASFLLLTAAVALYACGTSNGDPIPDPDYNAPDLDAGGSTLPPKTDGSTTTPPPPPSDGGGDASDAGGDADSGGPDPVADVRINELYINPTGGGANKTFVEVRGAPGTVLDELKLRILKADGTVTGEMSLVATAGDKIKANGTWSVGGALAPGAGCCDHMLLAGDLKAWGFDTTRGAVQLVRGNARTLIDVVGWDSTPDAGALPAPPSPPTQTAETRPALLTAVTNKSLGRKAAAADTNNNAADFCQMAPTASNLNAACD